MREYGRKISHFAIFKRGLVIKRAFWKKKIINEMISGPADTKFPANRNIELSLRVTYNFNQKEVGINESKKSK